MHARAILMAVTGILLMAGMAHADVFNLGNGLTSLETVRVGDPGNALDTRYINEWGNDIGYGAVSYEYNIGKYEVTTGQYTEFLNKVAGVDSYGLYNTWMWADTRGCKIERFSGSGTAANPYQYRVAADYANRPVNYVGLGDAQRFANWLQNGQPSGSQNSSTTENGPYDLSATHIYYGPDGSLPQIGSEQWNALVAASMNVSRRASWKWAIPSEDEWYKAAYYKGGSQNAGYWDYATRHDDPPWDSMADPYGNNANWSENYRVNPIDSGKWTTVVGEFQNSRSYYGTFDQNGNVDEFTETTFDRENVVIRGGSFSTNNCFYLRPCDRGYGNLISNYQSTGFRVSQRVSFPAPVSAPALTGVTIDGDLSDWSDSSDWSVCKKWNGAGLPNSTTKFKYAWNAAAHLMYVAVETTQLTGPAADGGPIIEVGGLSLVGNCRRDQSNNGTQFELREFSGTIVITNQDIEGGYAFPGVMAAATTVGGKLTIEMCFPVYDDWGGPGTAQANSPGMAQNLMTGQTVWMYGDIFGTAAYDGDATFANGSYISAWDKNLEDTFTGVTLVPEPATMSLLVLGGLALIRRRK